MPLIASKCCCLQGSGEVDAYGYSQLLNEIMPMIYKRFTDKAAEEWRQIYKVRWCAPAISISTADLGSS